MGDNSILTKKNLTKNDICRYMLSECSGYKSSTSIPSEDPDLFSIMDDEIKEDEFSAKQTEDEYFDELQRAQQEEWDAQREYEEKLSDIQDRYPDFDAKEAAFWGEDPEEAERKARIDDYLNNWY